MFQLTTMNLGGLLPADVSLSEMLESQQKQLEWCAHLRDTLGHEAAAKYGQIMFIKFNYRSVITCKLILL